MFGPELHSSPRNLPGSCTPRQLRLAAGGIQLLPIGESALREYPSTVALTPYSFSPSRHLMIVLILRIASAISAAALSA